MNDRAPDCSPLRRLFHVILLKHAKSVACGCCASRCARIVKNLITSDGDKHRISVLLALLRKDFINSVNNANNRKGGLLGLAAAAIALGQVRRHFSPCF